MPTYLQGQLHQAARRLQKRMQSMTSAGEPSCCGMAEIMSRLTGPRLAGLGGHLSSQVLPQQGSPERRQREAAAMVPAVQVLQGLGFRV